MAFATTSAAFASKPTGGSIFGNPQPQQQQQPSTSAFGNAPPLGQGQQQPSAFGSFAQNQQNSQPAAGGLFGQPSQQQQPQQQTGSLFAQPSQQLQQPSGGLFGQSSQQQQPSGGLFSQPSQQQQPSGSLFGQSSQQQPAGGLFGQNPQQQQQQPAGGLFGQSTQQQQQQNATGGGLFGSTTTQQPQQNVFAGFGGNTSGQQQQGGLFGAGTTNALQAQPTLQAGAFGGGLGSTSSNPLFGNRTQPQQQQQQQQFVSPNTLQPTGPLFTKSTKFNDLPENVKQILESIETHIQGRVQISKDLHQRKLGEEPTKGQEQIRTIHKDLINIATTIRNDLHHTQDLKAKVDQAVEDTIIATRIIDGFRNPQSGSSYLKDHARYPLEFFTRVTDQMRERLTWYKTTIEQIERKLTSSANQAQTPQGIVATLQAQHATFLALASKTAAIDAELQKVKALYTQLWRAKTGSVRDPFAGYDKPVDSNSDLGMGSLHVR
ncbi:hypothetical protein K443DRAFT_670846 [Laccaria amethystina LaAM-08-1]|uniref:Nucleoporin Nup54 alpha-helical domain-containing protein n=1 Tax=Laccaria amethystina LaAM-08-1 TaxID=1095629 RepID=A0A0C9XZ50_9AGAR|nr:hypothetical protein K443DRAFT_670846 [Laccaria amethystina LaAM-08-1]